MAMRMVRMAVLRMKRTRNTWIEMVEGMTQDVDQSARNNPLSHLDVRCDHESHQHGHMMGVKSVRRILTSMATTVTAAEPSLSQSIACLHEREGPTTLSGCSGADSDRNIHSPHHLPSLHEAREGGSASTMTGSHVCPVMMTASSRCRCSLQ